MRITMAGIFVDDQDKARRFYTDVLGFQVEKNAAYGSGAQRWLTVVSAESPGLELALGFADDSAVAFQKALREQGKPATALRTDDCRRDYEKLVARGVRFTMEPTKQPYGGTDAVFDDTCGNLICLHQD